jgi:hypothetical protein
MKTTIREALVATAALMLLACANASAAGSEKTQSNDAPASMTDEDLKAASERIRQTGQQLQREIKETIRKARAERAADAERKKEPDSARRHETAAAREARQRRAALAASQAQAKKEAAEGRTPPD